MAYPREVEAYPLSLIEAVEAVLTQGRRLVLPCDSDKEARGLRLRFYGLRRAMLDTLKTDEPHPLAQQVYKIRFSVGGDAANATLTIEYLEDAEDIQNLSRRVSAAIAKAE